MTPMVWFGVNAPIPAINARDVRGAIDSSGPIRSLVDYGLTETNANGEAREIILHERPVLTLKRLNDTETGVHRAIQVGGYYHEIDKAQQGLLGVVEMEYTPGRGDGWPVRASVHLGMTGKTDTQIVEACEWNETVPARLFMLPLLNASALPSSSPLFFLFFFYLSHPPLTHPNIPSSTTHHRKQPMVLPHRKQLPRLHRIPPSLSPRHRSNHPAYPHASSYLSRKAASENRKSSPGGM